MASGRARTERSTFEIPTVTTERLQLRAFQVGDLDAYAAMQANPEVMRFLVDGRSIPALKSGESWLVLWAIGRSAATGCGPAKKWTAATLWEASDILQPLDRPEPELAYSLDQPFWGQSFATEAATAARDWLFGHFPLARVTSFIRPDNHASIRVARRLGAVCKTRRRWFRKSYGRYSPPIHLDH